MHSAKKTNGLSRRPNTPTTNSTEMVNNNWTLYANRNDSRESHNNNNSNNREHSRTILVKNLNPQTIPHTLMMYFEKFEIVEDATLNDDDNGEPNHTATIIFSKPPLNPNAVACQHRIDGTLVQAEFTRNQSFESYSSNYNQSKIYASCLSLGSMKAPKEFIEEWMTTKDVRFVINYSMRNVHIFFGHLDEEYKIEYKFKDVLGDMVVERDRNATYFTITLRHPGCFWKRNQGPIQETMRSIKKVKQWERVNLIPLTHDVPMPDRAKALLPLSPEGFFNIGNWITFRIRFAPSLRFASKFEAQLKEAAEFNLVPRNLDAMKPFIKVTKAKDIEIKKRPKTHKERAELNIDYNVLYMLESAISYYYFNEYNLDDDFYTMITKMDPEIACGILQLIISGKERIWHPVNEIRKIFDRLGIKVKDRKKIPSHCALLRKVIVTPSHMYIQQPTVETTNRVVRHYKDHTDGFMRIQFTDEAFNRVGAGTTNAAKDAIYGRIFDVLKAGIQIGKKRYEFLAFSSSQLREQGCWFFAPTADLSSYDIRQWMGVFSHEKVVAKHAVRMGQCFSSTTPVYTLEAKDVDYTPDIKRNGYTFSDGVGKISKSLAEEVAIRLDLKVVPSAYQFRLGGAKGVLTIDKDLDEQNVKILLRPSQIKFESQHLTLEVIRHSTYIHGYLNRQAITLLSALKVPDDVFMTLMEEMVQDVNKLFQRPEEAIRVLLGNVDQEGTAISMVSIIQAGFLERGDPHIKNMLNLFRVNVLKDLKKKAKIIVPQGAYLLGVMDETNTLEEGEVFVQICDTSNNGVNLRVITGDVVVFRNPCFHPGDVRVVKAVDRENLHHLVDVVVFSQKGYRDLPSMCSGGDLDGDDYTVYWDPRLLPPRNFPPMDYTPHPPKYVDEVTILNIKKFFVNYINNDNLGQIANAHLATADLSAEGAQNGKCLRLAQLHSEAVDFPKSGKPALLTDDLKVKMFPDFMQKKDKESYQSQKVLGRIFRAIDKSDYKDYQSVLTADTIYDTRMRVTDMELYIVDAREQRSAYNQGLLALMNQFGVQTEAELISGYVIKWLKKGKSKSRYEQHEYTMKAVRKFKATWRKEFESEFLDASKSIDPTKRHLLEAKAAAWYYVTYHPNERRRDMSLEGGFFSFPWCILEYVCEIAKRNRPAALDIDALTPIPEEKIKEGNIRLVRMKPSGANIMIIDDSESESESESDNDDDSDDEIIPLPSAYNAMNVNSALRLLERNNNAHSPAIASPLNQRPLEPHQSVVSAEATEDELERALLGL